MAIKLPGFFLSVHSYLLALHKKALPFLHADQHECGDDGTGRVGKTGTVTFRPYVGSKMPARVPPGWPDRGWQECASTHDVPKRQCQECQAPRQCQASIATGGDG